MESKSLKNLSQYVSIKHSPLASSKPQILLCYFLSDDFMHNYTIKNEVVEGHSRILKDIYHNIYNEEILTQVSDFQE